MVKKTQKILINGIGPWLDKGESAILISMVDTFRREFSNVEISVVASTFLLNKVDEAKYGKYNLNVVPGIFQRFHEFIDKKNFKKFRTVKILITFVFFVFLVIKNTLWLLFYKYLNFNVKFLIKDNYDVINEYKDSNYVILCGGQNLIHTEHLPFFILYELFFAKLLNKPIMLYAQSIGPFKYKYGSKLIKYILNKVNIITTREKISKIVLDDLNVSTPSFVTADAAFSLPSIPKKDGRDLIINDASLPKDELFVGFTVIPWNFPGELNLLRKKELYENYINVLANVADYLINKWGVYVIFFPQVIIPSVKDDRIASKKVFRKIKNKSKVRILASDYTPEQLKGMYGNMELLIGTRFHSCIFSLSMNVPTIVIEYEGHKSSGIMSLLDLNDLVFEIEKLKFEDIKLKLDEVISNKEHIKELIKENMIKVQTENNKNIVYAKQYLKLDS